MSDTPETDAAAERNIYGVACKVDVDFARKLERERDKAQEELQEWKDGAYATEHPCPNEVHCTCVPLLLSKIAALRKERDEARRGIRLMAQNAEVWKERADQARRELDVQLESIKFHMERVPVRDHPLRADDAKLEMTQKEAND